MTCPEAAEDLLKSLRSGCDLFSKLLDSLTVDCRTPTRGVVPQYVLVSLGDAIGRSISKSASDILRAIRGCWCELGREERVILAVVLGRLAMICPEEVFESVRELRCGGKMLLSRWVYPVLGIWNPRYLDSLEERGTFLMAWAWYARYVPEDSELALDRIMERADVIDKPLIMALKEVRKAIPSKVFDRLKDKPELLRKVIP